MTAAVAVPPVFAEVVGLPADGDPSPNGSYCEAGYTADHEGELYAATVRGVILTLCLDCAILHNAEEIRE